MSYFTHLECSVPCGAGPFDPRVEQHLCTCGAPLLARYDMQKARAWTRDSLAARQPTMWRYRELMPLFAERELRLALVTNRLTGTERIRVMGELEAGEIDIAVGTHALIQESVRFSSLGVVVIDDAGTITASAMPSRCF